MFSRSFSRTRARSPPDHFATLSVPAASTQFPFWNISTARGSPSESAIFDGLNPHLPAANSPSLLIDKRREGAVAELRACPEPARDLDPLHSLRTGTEP